MTNEELLKEIRSVPRLGKKYDEVHRRVLKGFRAEVAWLVDDMEPGTDPKSKEAKGLVGFVALAYQEVINKEMGA